MSDGRVIIDIDGDDAALLSKFAGIGKKIDHELSGVGKTLSKTGDFFTKFITVPFLAATGAAVAFGVKSAGSFEQSAIAFETMLGSAQAGQKMFADLKKFAAETPFELPGLLDASKKLLAFGFDAGSIIPTLRSVGDAAAGLGAGTEGMERIITAMGQIKAKGKVSAEEMLQLAESGLPAWEAVATKIGVSIPEAMKLAERGAIKADTAIAALTEMMDKKFGGMMLKQSTTLLGLWSTFKDVFSIRLGEAFQKNLDPLKETLTQLIGVAGPFVDALIPAFIAVLEAAMPVIEDFTGLLQAFADASPETQEAVLGIVAALVAFGPVVKAAVGGMNLLHGTTVLLNNAKFASMLGNWGAALSIVNMNMGASVGTLASMGGQVRMVSAGYVALAGAAGFAIGSLINKIPEVAAKQKEWGETLGEFISKETQVQVASDATVAAWKAAGIQLDANNNLTDIGVAQLKAHNAANQQTTASIQTGTAATQGATAALAEYRNELVAVRNEQMGAERADIALEQAKNRLEDAQLTYNEAVAKYGPASREAEDAALNLRTANLDVEDATNRAAAAADALNKKIVETPRPLNGSAEAWMAYYQQIGDKASYAAAQADLANEALKKTPKNVYAKSSTGSYNIPLYGTGAYVDTAHLAVVGDTPELIFPLGDASFAEKYLPKLLESLPGRRGVAPGGGGQVSQTNIYQIGDVTIPSDDPVAQQMFGDLMRLVRQYQRMKPQGAM
ncbi:MAG: tape measure protein [Coriobacteriia bacterium]